MNDITIFYITGVALAIPVIVLFKYLESYERNITLSDLSIYLMFIAFSWLCVVIGIVIIICEIIKIVYHISEEKATKIIVFKKKLNK